MAMAPVLEVWVRGSLELVPLARRTVIGRSPANDIVLSDDPTVSRTHASVEHYGSGWAVQDLGASNGTFVNGSRILSGQILRPGDEIQVGDSRLVYREQESSDDGEHRTLNAERREHVTVLFSDMVDSTAMSSGLDPSAADRLRRDHFSLLREAIAASAGTEVKNLGDGLMVVFPSASAALACATAMQRGVRGKNLATGSSVGLRVGASCGDATRERNDYFGTPVIEASRLCSRAKGGQIFVADAVRITAGESSSWTFSRIGHLDLKGLPEPVLSFEVPWDALGDQDTAVTPADRPTR
jgi:class 3 adenylate cyclase